MCTGTEDTNPQRGMLITLELVSQTKAQQSCLTKTKAIHFVAVGCRYIVVLRPQVGCCNYVVHVEIAVIILENKNKKEHLVLFLKTFPISFQLRKTPFDLSISKSSPTNHLFVHYPRAQTTENKVLLCPKCDADYYL